MKLMNEVLWQRCEASTVRREPLRRYERSSPKGRQYAWPVGAFYCPSIQQNPSGGPSLLPKGIQSEFRVNPK